MAIGPRRYLGISLGNHARAHVGLGDFELALDYCRQSEAILTAAESADKLWLSEAFLTTGSGKEKERKKKKKKREKKRGAEVGVGGRVIAITLRVIA